MYSIVRTVDEILANILDGAKLSDQLVEEQAALDEAWGRPRVDGAEERMPE